MFPIRTFANSAHEVCLCVCLCVCGSLNWSKLARNSSCLGELHIFCQREHTRISAWICAAEDTSALVYLRLCVSQPTLCALTPPLKFSEHRTCTCKHRETQLSPHLQWHKLFSLTMSGERGGLRVESLRAWEHGDYRAGLETPDAHICCSQQPKQTTEIM